MIIPLNFIDLEMENICRYISIWETSIENHIPYPVREAKYAMHTIIHSTKLFMNVRAGLELSVHYVVNDVVCFYKDLHIFCWLHENYIVYLIFFIVGS